MMKRIALLLLCVLIVLSSVSCGRWYTADVDHEGNPILLGGDKLPDRKACEDAVNAVVELLKNGGTSVEMTKAVRAYVAERAENLNLELLETLTRNRTNFEIIKTRNKQTGDVFGDRLLWRT